MVSRSSRLPVCEYLRDVAQPGSALAWGARGRKFESCRPDLARQIGFFSVCLVFIFSESLVQRIHQRHYLTEPNSLKLCSVKSRFFDVHRTNYFPFFFNSCCFIHFTNSAKLICRFIQCTFYVIMPFLPEFPLDIFSCGSVAIAVQERIAANSQRFPVIRLENKMLPGMRRSVRWWGREV
jgi:hypothetical protein